MFDFELKTLVVFGNFVDPKISVFFILFYFIIILYYIILLYYIINFYCFFI